MTVDHISRYIAGEQQKYTQRGGARPFGIATLIIGFDPDGTPQLYQTDPAGIFVSWKASAIGRNSKTVREFLEKHYTEELLDNKDETIKLAVKALLEVATVDESGKNVEVAVFERGQELRMLTDEELDAIVAQIEAEKAAEEAESGGA